MTCHGRNTEPQTVFQCIHADILLVCSAWDDPEFVEAVLRLVLSRLVDSQLGVFAMLNFAVSIYAVGALTTKVSSQRMLTVISHLVVVSGIEV